MKLVLLHIAFVLTVAAAHVFGADATQTAQVLFRTLTGVPIAVTDGRLSDMARRITAGDIKGAAAIATEDNNFADVTLKHFASHISTRDEFQRTDLNDFIAMIIGTALDNRDAREILSADASYVGTNVVGLPAVDGTSNAHYAFLENSRIPLKGHLVRQSPQRTGIPGAGVLTSWTFQKNHAFRGTNRRLAEFTMRAFMCKSMSSLSDLNAPRDRIRQDVARTPGGNTSIFNNKCAGCHSQMDAWAGAFAKYNFEFNDAMRRETGTVNYSGAVQPKMNNNPTIYPAGYVTTDDSFVNYATFGANQSLGWRGPASGSGVAEFGQMVANSRQFSKCMAMRTYSQLCINVDYAVDRLTKVQTDQLEAAEPQIEGLAQDFETNGYNLKGLFGAAASLPKCLDR